MIQDRNIRNFNQIEEEIKKFKELHVQNIDIHELYEAIGHLIRGHTRTPYTMHPTGLIRARLNEKKIDYNNINQLWYPDWEKINIKNHEYGRCNDKGESMFYCSTEFDSTVCELRPNAGELITIMNCKPRFEKLNIKVQPIGINYLQELTNGYNNVFKHHFIKQKFILNDIAINKRLDSFLNESFHEIIDEKDNWKYKVSIAITKILIHSNINYDGVLYPSISTNMKGANYALKPDFVDKNILVETIGMYEVIEAEKDKYYKIKLVKIPERISPVIEWYSIHPHEQPSFSINF